MPNTSPFEQLNLRQYPPAKHGQAWCSADTLLVNAVRADNYAGEQILVVNDEFGALCTALQARTLWTDSYLTNLALKDNIFRNGLPPVERAWSTDDLSTVFARNDFATVVMRVPKQLSYFEFQLSELSKVLPTAMPLLVAGMDKHLPSGVATLLETYIGPTERHRGQRKARLFSARRDERQPALYSGTGKYPCDALNAELTSLPNVFAREKIDIGSRFLLENLNKIEPVNKAIDLACGNGIIGLIALKHAICKKLLLCDESAMAIASARINAKNIFPQQKISFHHGDGLLHFTGEQAELILCNPPFHLNHRVDEGVGRRLLVQAAAQLVKGGSLCLVANRHLNYLPVLKREFKRVDTLARNSKFIVWLATT